MKKNDIKQNILDNNNRLSDRDHLLDKSIHSIGYRNKKNKAKGEILNTIFHLLLIASMAGVVIWGFILFNEMYR